MNMTNHVAFLRAINVGGKTLLSMKDLSDLCLGIGLKNVRTYIQSGNVLFTSPIAPAILKTKLEKALLRETGKDIGVIIRNARELAAIVAHNPFPKAQPSQVGVLLLAGEIPKTFIWEVDNNGPEEIRPSRTEVYIHYPNGVGQTKLKLPKSVAPGTVRNINTIGKLAELAAI
jgi:uncharacterized protein (DUF1697 family)